MAIGTTTDARTCPVCKKEWETFAKLPELVGFLTGFDGEDHPVLLVMRNCDCNATLYATADRAMVEAAAKGTDRVAATAREALEDADMSDKGGPS